MWGYSADFIASDHEPVDFATVDSINYLCFTAYTAMYIPAKDIPHN